MQQLFINARLIIPSEDAGLRGSLLVENGVIKSVITEGMITPKISPEDVDLVIDCDDDYIFPGLIDIHCHGAMGRDAMEATPEAYEIILRYHLSQGTTLAVLSTVAAPLDTMLRVLTSAEEYKTTSGGVFLAGIHLEGPYFAVTRRGAHRESYLRDPTSEETRRLLNNKKIISRMTLAPEIPGTAELISEFIRNGISVSAGHSDASEAESNMGFDHGVTQVTHLYNCMSSQQSRFGRRTVGLAEAALTRPGILCELIADGVHLPATLLRLAWMAKGWKELILVSDATAGAGLGEGAQFELGEIPCQILDGAAWTGEATERRLAGSTASLLKGVRFMVEEVDIPFWEAVSMASLVPAKALGIEQDRGSIALGKRADLVRVSRTWQVRDVWSAGAQVA